MRPAGRIFFWGLLMMSVVGRGVASSSDTVVKIVDADRLHPRVTLQVLTPRVLVDPGGEGGAVVRLEGYGALTRERRIGAPDIPTKAIRVAIPPGVVPRLELTEAGDTFRTNVIPRAVPRESAGTVQLDEQRLARDGLYETRAPEVRKSFEKNFAFYTGEKVHPEQLAWLGEIGELRDQRYVEVHLAPVRFDPSVGGLRVALPFTVTVHFDGDTLQRTEPHVERRFEGVYRNAFVNYDQGSTFRMSRMAQPSAPVAASSVFGDDEASSFHGTDGVGNPPVYRIRVTQDGIVRFDHALISGTPLINELLANWKLTNNGVEVPLDVRDDDADGVPEFSDGNGMLDPGEWVQFWGQELKLPKTVLNTDFPGTDQDIYEYHDVTDENVYYLTAEVGSRVRMRLENGSPSGAPPPTEFDAVTHVEIDDIWIPLGGVDPWKWGPAQSNPPVSTVVENRIVGVDLPGLVSGTDPARVVVRSRGLSADDDNDGDHPVRVSLMNDTSDVLAFQDSGLAFDGRTIFDHDFTWTHTGGPGLTDPAQVFIETQAFAGEPGYRNQIMLDYVQIHYKRGFNAINDVLQFQWPNPASALRVRIEGFDSHDPVVYEVTGIAQGGAVINAVEFENVVVIPTTQGTPPYSVRFGIRPDDTIPDGELRTFIVAGDAHVNIPAPGPSFEPDTVSNLRANGNQADIVVIAHPDVLADPVNCADPSLTALLALRASQGLTSRVVCIQDVYDEFNGGIEGPQAIKNFVDFVMSTEPGEGWLDPRPQYLMLLGDASYDARGGTASFNYVPTQILFRDRVQLGYYASDNLLASGDDQLADIPVGRIATHNPAETAVVLDKIRLYEEATPAGNWKHHAVFVSDRGKRDSSGDVNGTEALEFETTSALGEAFMKIPPHTSLQLRYWSDYCDNQAPPPQSCDRESMRADIKAAVRGIDGVSDGTAVVQYSGHGNSEVWSDDAYWDERDPPALWDTNDLDNGLKLPWVLAHNCLTGSFHTLLDHSVGENWMKLSGGGSVAVLSPSGLSFNFLGSAATSSIYDHVYGPRKERELGVVVLDMLSGLCLQGSIEGCQNYILQGDPATQLILPSVDPPTLVQAVGGNGFVDLSWTASPGGADSYDIYRTNSLLAPFEYLDSVDGAETTYRDEDARNTFQYYYFIVALDVDGFESRWSNFNSQCDGGPDCVTATPLNPDPPSAPTGLDAVDPETGGRLDVSWNFNPEDDISVYTVSYGIATGVYTDSVTISSLNNTVSLGSLQNGQMYFINITVTNTSGNTSPFDPADEVTAVPTLVLGERAPTFIEDLRIGKNGTDAELTWTEITKDIYDKPETVAFYEIFRDTDPGFIPSDTNKIADCPSPCSTYSDPNALAAAEKYHYLVRAVDIDGNRGGAGRQLPAGILDVVVDRTPTTLTLAWSPVTTVFHPGGAGAPTTISHYEVYGSSTPMSRADLDGMVPVASPVASTVELPLPVGGEYYSVLAVDTRGNKSPF